MCFDLVLSSLHSTLRVNDSTFLLNEVAEPDGSEVDVEEPVGEGLEPDGLTAIRWLTLTQSLNQRMPPLRLTRRTSKCSG
jgi:hypothetical protein